MMVITDPTYAALSAPQRAVLALEAAWAGKRPDPRLLAMPSEQRAEFDRLYGSAARANVRLGRLIRTLHAQAEQERLTVTAWEMDALFAGMLDQIRWTLDPVGDAKLAALLEGGVAAQCPRSLDDLDETPAGRRAQLLKAARDRLFAIAHRGYAAAEIFESIREALGADPLQPELRALLEGALDTAEDALFQIASWLGPALLPDDDVAYAEVARLVDA